MSNGRYGHDIRRAADSSPPRGPRRNLRDSEEPDRKRAFSSRWDADAGRRDLPSPGGSSGTGASGGNGGNGGNGVSIRGRAADDLRLRRESSDVYSGGRSPPIHPHRLQTTMQHLAESGLTSNSPSSAVPLSAQSNSTDHIIKGSFLEKSKGDNTRDNGPQGSSASDRIGFKLESARRKKNEDERHDNVFSPPSKVPRATFSRRSSGADKEPSLDPSNDFVKAFAEYTEAVIATSNLTFKRNLLKEKGEKQQSLRHRWARHYQSFASLAEDQSRGTEKSASTLELSDFQIKKSQETQEKTVRRLVSSIFANGAPSNPRLLDDSSVNREISTIKADLRDFESMIDDSKQNIKKTLKHGTILNDLERNFRNLEANSMTKSAMTDYESKLAHLTVNLQKQQNLFSQHENAFAQLPHMQDLVDKVKGLLMQFIQDKDNLSARIDQQNNRLDQQISGHDEQKSQLDQQKIQLDQQNSDFKKLKEEQQSHHEALIKALDDQKRDFEQLKLEVTGDPEQEVKGLIEYITACGDRIERVEKNLGDFDGEIESIINRIFELESKMSDKAVSAKLESELDNFRERLEGFETNIRLLQEKNIGSDPNTGSVSGDKMDLTESIAKAEDRFRNLEERMEHGEQDAVEKDEIVSGEVGRLEGLLNLQAEETKKLREELLAIRTEAAAAASVVGKQLRPPSPVNSPPRVEESLLRRIPALENDFKEFKDPMTQRTDTIEVLVESLQQRFDNLTTEHLATAIIHQMQVLYPPHPANIQNELVQTKGRLGVVEHQMMPALWSEVTKFNVRIDQVGQMTSNLRTELFNLVEQKFKDSNTLKSGAHNYNEMESRVSNLVNEFHARSLQVEQKFAEFTKESAESIDNLRKAFEGFKTSLDSQSLQINGLLRDMTALRSENASNMTSINETLREMGLRLQTGEEEFLKELPSIHADIALLNQHTQIKHPLVIAAIVAAQMQEQTEGQEQEQQHGKEQEQPASVAGAIDPMPSKPQHASEQLAAAAVSPPATEAKGLTSPNDNQNVQQSPSASRSENVSKNSPAPPTLKRHRVPDNVDLDDDDPDDSSQDVRPMKIHRRRGSIHQIRKDQESRVATAPSTTTTMTPTTRPGSSSRAG